MSVCSAFVFGMRCSMSERIERINFHAILFALRSRPIRFVYYSFPITLRPLNLFEFDFRLILTSIFVSLGRSVSVSICFVFVCVFSFAIPLPFGCFYKKLSVLFWVDSNCFHFDNVVKLHAYICVRGRECVCVFCTNPMFCSIVLSVRTCMCILF